MPDQITTFIAGIVLAAICFALGFVEGRRNGLNSPLRTRYSGSDTPPKHGVPGPAPEYDLLSIAEMIRHREYHTASMKLHVEEMRIMGQTGAPVPASLKRYLSVNDLYRMGCARRAAEAKQDAEMFTVLPELSSDFRETAAAAKVKRGTNRTSDN